MDERVMDLTLLKQLTVTKLAALIKSTACDNQRISVIRLTVMCFTTLLNDFEKISGNFLYVSGSIPDFMGIRIEIIGG